MKSELIAIILETLRGMGPDYQPESGQWTSATPLFGADGVLDSLGLTTLVVALEQAVEDRYGALVSLADDKAFSQKHSPFRTVDSLAAYAEQVVGAVTR